MLQITKPVSSLTPHSTPFTGSIRNCPMHLATEVLKPSLTSQPSHDWDGPRLLKSMTIEDYQDSKENHWGTVYGATRTSAAASCLCGKLRKLTYFIMLLSLTAKAYLPVFLVSISSLIHYIYTESTLNPCSTNQMGGYPKPTRYGRFTIEFPANKNLHFLPLLSTMVCKSEQFVNVWHVFSAKQNLDLHHTRIQNGGRSHCLMAARDASRSSWRLCRVPSNLQTTFLGSTLLLRNWTPVCVPKSALLTSKLCWEDASPSAGVVLAAGLPGAAPGLHQLSTEGQFWRRLRSFIPEEKTGWKSTFNCPFFMLFPALIVILSEYQGVGPINSSRKEFPESEAKNAPKGHISPDSWGVAKSPRTARSVHRYPGTFWGEEQLDETLYCSHVFSSKLEWNLQRKKGHEYSGSK